MTGLTAGGQVKIPFQEILAYLESNPNKTDFKGNPGGYICSMANLQELSDHTICWIKDKKYLSDGLAKEMQSYRDILVVCPFALEIEGVSCIVTEYPKGVFFDILNRFFDTRFAHSVSDQATVLTQRVGANVHIGANCYIGKDVEIGDNTIIHPNVSIISPCKIGHDCEIFPGVVIGADGFGYFLEDGVPYREKHFRGVVIGNYVEIGANTCIDRGLLTDTTLRDHVKIDNLCHIGHNVTIEENCMVIAGTVVCGSAVIKKNAYLAPASVILNQISVGQHAVVGVNSAAIMNVKDGVTAFGTPARRLSSKG